MKQIIGKWLEPHLPFRLGVCTPSSSLLRAPIHRQEDFHGAPGSVSLCLKSLAHLVLIGYSKALTSVFHDLQVFGWERSVKPSVTQMSTCPLANTLCFISHDLCW